MKVILAHDAAAVSGRLDEQDGFVQVREVEAILHRLGHETSSVAVDLDLGRVRRELLAAQGDLVFNLVESVEGIGRWIHLFPTLLDGMCLPYTGSGTETLLATSDKIASKRRLLSAGVPTPGFVDPTGRIVGHPPLPGRFIVKSVWEDASLGLDDTSVIEADTVAEVVRQIQDRRNGLGGVAFAESWVDGREFNVALLEGDDGEPEVLPIAEMCFRDYPPGKPRLVGYDAKWREDSFEYTHTVRDLEGLRQENGLAAELGRMAVLCWHLFGLRGYTRVDVRLDADDHPWVLEVNPNPCLSEDAGFFAAATERGLAPSEVVNRLLTAATKTVPTLSHP